jgi:tetratricopeptide (TPR) repeat protein
MRQLVCVALACLVPLVCSAQALPSDAMARRAYDHYFEGQLHLSSERWERAAREFNAAIKLHPLLTDAHYGLGQAFMGLERFTSAALAFQDCLDAARSVHGLRESARVKNDHLTLEIIDEIRDTIRRRGPNSLRARQLDAYATRLQANRASLRAPFAPPPPVLLSLGSAHFRLQNTTRAEFYWREAVRVDPAFGEAWSNLAVVFLTQARKEEAQHAVRSAERAGFRVNPRLKDDIQRLP